jgi:WD40 repeat protein
VFLRDGFYAQGQAFVFAPNNRTVAVWNNDILTAIPLLTTDRDYGGEPVQQNIMLEGDSDVLSALSGKGAWSPDGSLLAYSDERGLWLWDALQPFGPPTLLLRANLADIPTAVRFSPLGNYLLIAQNDPFRNRQKVRFWLDLRTMQTIRDGVISPDEMFLVAVNTDPLETAMGRSPLQMCFLDPDGERCGGQSRNYIVEQIEWRDNRRYIMTTCANENYDTPCWVRTYYFEGARDPSYFAPSRPPSWESPYYYSLYRGRSFDYDPLHDSVVSIVDEDTIRVDDQVYQIRAMLDGSDYLSADDTFGEIVKVEWMPSLFYHD